MAPLFLVFTASPTGTNEIFTKGVDGLYIEAMVLLVKPQFVRIERPRSISTEIMQHVLAQQCTSLPSAQEVPPSW